MLKSEATLARTADAASTQAVWQCGRFALPLARPLLMAILNVTPDSFSDGGRHATLALALAAAEQALADGADILDIGGESTRPGAQPVSLAEEMDRVLPVLEACVAWGVPLSVDTRHAEVMREAVRLGADILNDVQGFQGEGALAALADSSAGACVMHMQGQPQHMQVQPQYTQLRPELLAFFRERVHSLVTAGVAPARIVLDPGFGFGKTLDHNLSLLKNLSDFLSLGLPVLVGLSRKSMFGQLTGASVLERLPATLAATCWAVQAGAKIIRTHDVLATRQAITVWNAVQQHE